MTDTPGGRASVPAPTVGESAPQPPAVAAALDQHQAAKAAYLADPTEANAAAKRATGDELRYQRWVARGGPRTARTRATQAFYDRYDSEG